MLIADAISDIFGENGALPEILSGIMAGVSSIANFFTTNTLGIIILVVSLISIVWALFMKIFNKIH